jgi:hypothetical protein
MTDEENLTCEGWTHGTLLTYMLTRLSEMDRRYEDRFRAEEIALKKAEAAQEAKNATLNNLRGVVTDQQGAFARTTVVNLQMEAIITRVGLLELDIRGIKERGTGMHSVFNYLGLIAGLIIAAAAIFFKTNG